MKSKKRIPEHIVEDIKITENFYLDDYEKATATKFSQKERFVWLTLLHKAGDNQFKPFNFSIQRSKHYIKDITQREFDMICQTLKKHKIIDFTKPINPNEQPLYKVNLFKDRNDI